MHTTRSRTGAFAVASLLLAPQLVPQELTEPAPSTRRLVEAMEKMQALDSVRYTISQKADTVIARQVREQMGGRGRNPFGDGSPEELEMVLADGVLHVEKGSDQLVMSGARMIARNAELPWSLRRDGLVDGSPAPFLFMPQTFLTVLSELNPTVVHTEVGTHEDRPIEILTVTLDGDHAAELWNSGEMLPMQGQGAFGMAGLQRGGRGGRPSLPKTTVDVAFTVDPALSLIHEIKLRCYQESAMGRAVTVVAGTATTQIAMGAARVEEEAEEEGEAAGPSRFEGGLPVRNAEKLDVLELDVSFTEHGEAVGPELDERARRLLGLKR